MARDVPTSAVSFVETEHGRLRRKQRGIDTKDLKAAKKYGQRYGSHPRPNGDPTSKYLFNDIVYIVNDITAEEVTSYAVPIQLDPVPMTNEMYRIHVAAETKLQEDMSSWTSNTVLVVDRSGSMRASDMWGSRNRLGSVWMSIALDFVAHRIESEAASTTDVVSVVTLEERPVVVIKEQPCTWVLYNELAKLYNDATIHPKGHGPFLPSLDNAEELLLRNSNASCAMALCFLSDGKPSDAAVYKYATKEKFEDMIISRVGSLAKKFGRRLTFTAIGIGINDDFGTLEKMVEAAKDYGAVSSFRLPSMTSASLGETFTSVATSLTTTQTEMTDVVTFKQNKIRDVERESRKKASQDVRYVTDDDFYIYRMKNVKRTVYREEVTGRKRVGKFEEAPLQDKEAGFVAMSKGPFGEGGERFAYRFFELAKDGFTVVGSPLVAKESRLVLDGGAHDERARRKFVQTFCSTQQFARRIAEEFNEKLASTRRVDKSTPRISFLDCSVYQLNDINVGELSVLVEEKLDHNQWFKWNANNGYVDGMKGAPKLNDMDIRKTMNRLTQNDLTIIEEDEEEEDSDGDEHAAPTLQPVCFTPSEVAQAFSHFSYWATGRKRLICDLQGVFDEKENVLRLSDPVIHYHSHSNRRFVHGRTDRGWKGIGMFFETHHEHCGHLCKLVNRGFRARAAHSNRSDATHKSHG
jgi:hypothetical protein